MKNELNSWDKQIVTAILANKEYNIIEVKEMETVKSLFFDTIEYGQIKKLLEEKKPDSILDAELQRNKDFEEYLIIIKFKDQRNKLFFASVYDSDELWQYPEIIDLFPQ